MRIAVTSQNRLTVTGHAGRCQRFLVYELEGGVTTSRALVEVDEAQTLHQHHELPPGLGRLDAFITGGMGQGLFARLTALGITPVVTSETAPDAAVAGLLAGTLVRGEAHAHGAGGCGSH